MRVVRMSIPIINQGRTSSAKRAIFSKPALAANAARIPITPANTTMGVEVIMAVR